MVNYTIFRAAILNCYYFYTYDTAIKVGTACRVDAESACVESTTRHYNRGARGRTYTPADHRRMRLRGNVYRSSITDVKRRYTKHCNVNKMADSSGLGPGKFIMFLTL